MIRRLAGVLLLVAALPANADSPTREVFRIIEGADVEGLKTLFVEHRPSDKRNLHVLIAKTLNEMSFVAKSGKIGPVPTAVDAIVSYQDKWIGGSWYPIELTITLRNPETRYPFAVGTVVRGSLNRGTIESLTKENMTNIMTKQMTLGTCRDYCGILNSTRSR